MSSGITVNVIDKVPLLISRVNHDLIYLYVNQTYEKWFNIPVEKIIGKSMQEVLGAEALKKLKPHLEKVLSGQIVEFENSLPYISSESKTVHVKYIPETIVEGRVKEFIVIVSDISELRRNKDLHIASEQRLRYALQATGEGVWDWKVSDGTVFHNSRWCEILGLDQAFLEHPLEFFSNRIHTEDVPLVMEKLKLCLEEDIPYRSEHRLQHADGHYIWVMDRGAVVERDADNKPLRMVGSVRDITEVREAQARLEGVAKMASLGEMASGIAHEINNPLAIINGRVALLSQMAEKKSLGSDVLETELKKIQSTVSRIARIIAGLKTFSRNADRDPMVTSKVKELFMSVTEICQERFRSLGIEVRINCADDLSIDCRPGQIHQVLLNLIGNAVDAIAQDTKKWIELNALIQNQSILISVTDSGKRIPKSIVEKMMQPFFTTKQVEKGTGLGLSISKNLVSQHGGDLWYDANSIHTRFIFSMPRTAQVSLDNANLSTTQSKRFSRKTQF